MGVRIRSLGLKAEHETTYISSVRIFLDGSIQRTLWSIAVRKTMRTSSDILTHAYTATGDGLTQSGAKFENLCIVSKSLRGYFALC